MANDATIELSLELDLILGSGEDAVDFILSASIIPDVHCYESQRPRYFSRSGI